ncbi:TIR domain-containing protein [Xenorhabdus bovienii]|uniref:Thoeris protein ThsB TIR-like domain-containing protein n=1 Tax=Xenorhabdus bovienii str. oregonense TaxID=1398202 RepID=A0A077P2G6_XENBV|nr:TIR domain-containing protein [Xenorhabdus bovienii]MDE9516538.1 TIR domain-containing protein [Xenorhabdus bovienii]CDH04888.1 conserved hypothetical protein [Xenorhabdus bovienii str. oregonense]
MHKTFLSYHHANEQDLKDRLIEKFGGETFIDKSVNDGDISTDVSDEYIMRRIREDYLGDSTVTVVLIGTETARRPFVNSEIQASLWGENSAGLVGVIRDELYPNVFSSGSCVSSTCNCGIGTRTIQRGYDHYLPWLIKKNHSYPHTVAHYNDIDVYCSLVKYSDFINSCEFYINQAFDKRSKMSPAAKRNPSDVPAIRTNILW